MSYFPPECFPLFFCFVIKTAFLNSRCDHCLDCFKSVRDLRRHQNEKHAEEFTFKCEHHQCGQIFRSADQLKKHETNHVKIPCSQCGKLIQTKGMFKHVRQVHGIDEKIVCDLCGKVSNSIAMHKYHVRSDHEVHQRLQCDICKEWLVGVLLKKSLFFYLEKSIYILIFLLKNPFSGIKIERISVHT